MSRFGQPYTMDVLPDEIVSLILSFCALSDIKQVVDVCQRFKRLRDDYIPIIVYRSLVARGCRPTVLRDLINTHHAQTERNLLVLLLRRNSVSVLAKRLLAGRAIVEGIPDALRFDGCHRLVELAVLVENGQPVPSERLLLLLQNALNDHSSSSNTDTDTHSRDATNVHQSSQSPILDRRPQLPVGHASCRRLNCLEYVRDVVLSTVWTGALEDDLRDRLFEHGIVEVLLQVLRNAAPTNYTTQIITTGALWNMALGDTARDRIGQLGGIPDIVQLLRSDHMQCCEKAAGCLRNLAFKSPDNQRQIVRQGSVPLFIDLLQRGSELGREHAASALANMSFDQEIALVIHQAGAVPTLTSLIEPPYLPSADRAVGVLWNLACITALCADIVAAGALPRLAHMLSSGSMTSKRCSAGALWTLTVSSIETARAVADLGTLELATAMIRDEQASEAHEFALGLLYALGRHPVPVVADQVLQCDTFPCLVDFISSHSEPTSRCRALAALHAFCYVHKQLVAVAVKACAIAMTIKVLEDLATTDEPANQPVLYHTRDLLSTLLISAANVADFARRHGLEALNAAHGDNNHKIHILAICLLHAPDLRSTAAKIFPAPFLAAVSTDRRRRRADRT